MVSGARMPYACFALDPSYGVEGDVHTVILACGAYKYALPPTY